MAKKRKKIRRPQTPPLSWVDKAIYCALFLLLLGGMVLAVVLMDALRAKIAAGNRRLWPFGGVWHICGCSHSLRTWSWVARFL